MIINLLKLKLIEEQGLRLRREKEFEMMQGMHTTQVDNMVSFNLVFRFSLFATLLTFLGEIVELDTSEDHWVYQER
jgi:hypothetical protein